MIPSHFRNLMFIFLQKLIRKRAKVYMDDIIIATETKEEQYNLLKEILDALGSYGFIISRGID